MQPFKGIRVIDLTHVLAGPFCTYQLAVLGADVVKIEAPDDPDMMRPEGSSRSLGEDGRGTTFLCQNGNKRSLAIDLKRTRGQEIVRKLAVEADVLVTNYRMGVLERFGLGWEALREANPRLIYATMTGFGHTGPKAGHPAYDNVIQAYSGLMAATGTPDEHPVMVGPPVLDYGTGAQAAFSIAAALFQRSRTGKGQRIDVAMLDAALMLMTTSVIETQVRGRTGAPKGNVNPTRAGYSCFRTADGLLMIGAFTGRQNARMWRVLGRADIAERVLNADTHALTARADEDLDLISQLLMTKPAAEWEALLNAGDVPAARVRRIDEAIASEQVASRRVLQEAEPLPETGAMLKTPVAAFSYAEGGPAVTRPAPRLGEHTAEVLTELGLSRKEVAALAEAGVVKVA
jgi:crotonobetainyl-CoA:carnitine CoA-transferase CaiB-like acyl-CoA transferase